MVCKPELDFNSVCVHPFFCEGGINSFWGSQEIDDDADDDESDDADDKEDVNENYVAEDVVDGDLKRLWWWKLWKWKVIQKQPI